MNENKENKVIRQRLTNDCNIVALSMLLNISYEDVLIKIAEMMIRRFNETDKKGIEGLLRKSLYNNKNIFPFLTEYEVNDTKAMWDYINDNKISCIIDVPSKNIPGVRHSIYFDGEQIEDPSNGNIYSPLEMPLEICNITFFDPYIDLDFSF